MAAPTWRSLVTSSSPPTDKPIPSPATSPRPVPAVPPPGPCEPAPSQPPKPTPTPSAPPSGLSVDVLTADADFPDDLLRPVRLNTGLGA